MFDQLHKALIDARETGTKIEADELPVPDYAEVLKIQQLVQKHLGDVSGFKVARRGDLPPIIAPIPTTTTYGSGADVPTHDQLGIELEIGFELIADPGSQMTTDPCAYFRPVVAIELVDTRIVGDDIDPMLKFADMQMNAGLVVGPRMDGWTGTDFSEVKVTLDCGGQTIANGAAIVQGGSALSNLALLCDNLGDHCGGLKKGHIVITGSLTGLDYYPVGTNVKGNIAGFGDVICQLV